jgi:transglutaminase-like putative cysteine protease
VQLAISHETLYRYDSPVKRSTQVLRLSPVDGAGQRVLRWVLTLPGRASRGRDAYGNVMHVLSMDRPHTEIRLRAEGLVETRDGPPQPDPQDDFPPELFLRDSALTRADAALRAFAQAHAGGVAADPRHGLLTLMRALGLHMPYTPGCTDAATPAAEAFERRLGVCQDHAQVFATCVRLLGLPVRYVSGYLATDDHHVASHAWAEVRLVEGWLGFDVSNQCLADGRYVKLAIGADYLDACPVRGMRLGGSGEAMQAQVQVSLGQG